MTNFKYQRIVKISVIILIAIGIVELVTGFPSGSVVATADGLDSISDVMISFIVLLGLRIAHRPTDRKFHFGYHRVESLGAPMAAILKEITCLCSKCRRFMEL